jgi:hypothetical protein
MTFIPQNYIFLGKLKNKITEIALSKKCQISLKKSKFGNIENIDISISKNLGIDTIGIECPRWLVLYFSSLVEN